MQSENNIPLKPMRFTRGGTSAPTLPALQSLACLCYQVSNGKRASFPGAHYRTAHFSRSRHTLQVKALTPKYFPRVEPDAVVFVTSRVPVRLLRPGTWVDGAVDRNVRARQKAAYLQLQGHFFTHYSRIGISSISVPPAFV